MDKKEAERILKCWINCPCAFNHGQCEKDVYDYCELGCWSPKQVREAVSLLMTELKFKEGENMRINRFRYRAWNKINKQMHTGLPYSAVGKDTFDVILKHPQIYEVMQCADVTDNDGVLVFEGDYLSDGKTIWRVEYAQTMNGFYAKAVGGYIPSDCKIFSLYHLCNRHNEKRLVSVVGNIYEYTGAVSELLN